MSSLVLLLLAVLAPAVRAQGSNSCASSLCFASGLSTGAVLQRGGTSGQRAALYGSVGAGESGNVSLVLTSVGGGYSKTFPCDLRGDRTWRLLLDPMPTGGNFSATVAQGTRAVTISDLTFGDVYYVSGQSNAWLPLWFTFERNSSTERVAAGQYSNIRLWRGGMGETNTAGNWMDVAGLEPGSDSSDALTNQWRRPVDLLSPNNIRDGEPWLWEFPSTAFYLFQYLTDMLGGEAPPFGVMTTPVGGTMVEQWTSPAAQAMCSNVTCMCQKQGCDPYQPLNQSICTSNSNLYWGNVQPFVNITVKGFAWYQGENNLQYDGGNSALGTGYGCLFPQMIREWRALWSAVPGTTDPFAPFGFVSLADGTDESFGVSMAKLRWASTANFGTAPNPAMPNTFVAQAYDAGDPWDAYQCADPEACCVDDFIALGPNCKGDNRGKWSVNGTGWFMGQVHPRTKGLVGQRLAQAAYASIYGGNVISTGPVFTGCTVAGSKLQLLFNATLLAGETVSWSKGATVEAENTALYVLVGSSLPEDAAANHHDSSNSYAGSYSNGNELGVTGWVAVNAREGPGPATLTVDLSSLNGATPTAVRYAFGTGGWGAPFVDRMCCGPTVDVTLEPCAPASCPLKATGPNTLPAVPFVAAITPAGKCACLPPQVCDA